MTRAKAFDILKERTGYDERDNCHVSDEDLFAAVEFGEGQPCNDCGTVVDWCESAGWWLHISHPEKAQTCFLA